MKVLLLGGLGGHAGQALGIAHYLAKERIEFDVLTLPGTEWRFEGLASKVLTAPQAIKPITGELDVKSLFKVIATIVKLKKYKVVIANGSNFAVPPSIWEKLRGARLINVEIIDAVVEPSRAPRLLHKFSDVTFVQWEELREKYPGSKVSGPVYEPPKYEPRDEGYILVTAGSLGYKELFDAAVRTFEPEELVIQTGKVPPEKYKVKKSFSFSKDFHRWIAGARAVITTFPGSTSAIASLGYGKPVVIVPNFELARGSPLTNMKPLARKLGAEVASLDGLKEALERAIRKERPKYPHGGERIVQEVIDML